MRRLIIRERRVGSRLIHSTRGRVREGGPGVGKEKKGKEALEEEENPGRGPCTHTPTIFVHFFFSLAFLTPYTIPSLSSSPLRSIPFPIVS